MAGFRLNRKVIFRYFKWNIPKIGIVYNYLGGKESYLNIIYYYPIIKKILSVSFVVIFNGLRCHAVNNENFERPVF